MKNCDRGLENAIVTKNVNYIIIIHILLSRMCSFAIILYITKIHLHPFLFSLTVGFVVEF